MITAFAPGRVNLIGDHTDTSGGLALPMAIQLGTTVSGTERGDRVRLRSDAEATLVDLPLRIDDPAGVEPAWGRYVAGIVDQLSPARGFQGTVTTTLPLGAGLASSAALELAVALALGFEGTAQDLATLTQRAEHRASGVPCGVMDQLASAAGVRGSAVLLDCSTLSVTPIAIPDEIEIVVVHSGEPRRLGDTDYAERRGAVETAERTVGPLRAIASPASLDDIEDPVIRRRARHVVTENQRVRDAVDALRSCDATGFGTLMAESQQSLAEDFEVSTPTLDALVADLTARPGVLGARLTGAGFGGCAVALCRPGALTIGWKLHPSDGALRRR